ncbi:phosphate/phosphite/phosphonate ABC transporter substrate-binding protein [Thiocapsa marina]|uniref:ABC-type phosphate/phosphonate transport system periplasmic component-like protein n=1 Tax=Thiocapsa marina 5811 TaxID=768671 RepID=F9UE47_9GAMM|nr:PhnD/SsuA/transferrin family substrate-binding protein [Thiocapsa marina]EGV17604.1 ABC-type phosphate/phosphonate transport system periplasmic component-like protein [Thiocapsa marina 5811]
MARKNPTKASIQSIGLWLCACAAALGAAPGSDHVEIPVLPYLSTERLLTLYEPLRRHLQETLARPVRLVTSPDYRSFIADVAQDDNLLVINAAHMARLAEVDSGYRSILQTTNPLYALVVVRAEDSVNEVADLRGTRILTPDPLALITLMGHRMLAEAGLTPGTDVEIPTADTHNNALTLLLGDDSIRAAIVSNRAYKTLSADARARLRVLADSAGLTGIPSLVYQTGPGHEGADRALLTREILHFANETSAGRAMMLTLGHGGLREVAEADRKRIDPFLPATREVLAAP